MKLCILGSAAAEGIPGYFCECPVCRAVRLERGKNLRRRTSYLVDRDTLIDCGPDFFHQCREFIQDSTLLKRIVVTHAHGDHLDPYPFRMRKDRYCLISQQLTVIAADATFQRIQSATGYTLEEMRILPRHIGPGETLTDGDLTIHAVRASHAPDTNPLNYFLTRGGKTILIQNDSGWWSEESWRDAAAYGVKADLVIIESTFGFGRPDDDGHHLGVNATVRFRDKLQELGVITEKTICATNHFSHNGNPMQDKLEAFFLPRGIIPAYDGLEFEI